MVISWGVAILCVRVAVLAVREGDAYTLCCRLVLETSIQHQPNSHQPHSILQASLQIS